MGSKECFEWFDGIDKLIEESDCIIGGVKRFLERLTEEPENTGGGPALDRALYDEPGGRWDDMGRY